MKQPNKFFSTLIFSIFVIFHSFSQVDTLKVRGEITSTHDACKKVDVQAKYNGDWNKYLVNTLEKKLKNYTPTKNERISKPRGSGCRSSSLSQYHNQKTVGSITNMRWD